MCFQVEEKGRDPDQSNAFTIEGCKETKESTVTEGLVGWPRSVMTLLRGYQEGLVGQARAHFRAGRQSVLVRSFMGSGKTHLAAFMLQSSAERGLTSWFVCHRKELIEQTSKTLYDFNINHGIVSPHFEYQPEIPTQVCSIQSLVRKARLMKPPSFLIFDEAHHLGAKTWSALFNLFPSAFKILLTATPVRLDGQGLRKFADEMIHGPPVSWLIENGFLSPYKMYAPPLVDANNLPRRMGEFVKSDVSALCDKPTITGNAINEYNKYVKGKRAVVFCASVEHSRHVADAFSAAGIPSAHVDGETRPEIRANSIAAFKNGDVRVLTNVDLFGEGFDLPALEATIMLRPTASLSLYLQQAGRALRASPGKSHAIILDHVGNHTRHGLPDDDHEWSLDGVKKATNKNGDDLKVKTCKGCLAVFRANLPSCPECGLIPETKERKPPKEVRGDLVEIKKEQMKARMMAQSQERKRASSLDELVALGKSRGYKNPQAWAEHVINGRNRRRV